MERKNRRSYDGWQQRPGGLESNHRDKIAQGGTGAKVQRQRRPNENCHRGGYVADRF